MNRLDPLEASIEGYNLVTASTFAGWSTGSEPIDVRKTLEACRKLTASRTEPVLGSIVATKEAFESAIKPLCNEVRHDDLPPMLRYLGVPLRVFDTDLKAKEEAYREAIETGKTVLLLTGNKTDGIETLQLNGQAVCKFRSDMLAFATAVPTDPRR